MDTLGISGGHPLFIGVPGTIVEIITWRLDISRI